MCMCYIELNPVNVGFDGDGFIGSKDSTDRQRH